MQMLHRLLRSARPHLMLVGLVAVLGACGADDGPPVRGTPTNVILISLDTCRADRLSCYGNPNPVTPRLDAFASAAVQFQDCLSQSCVTAPAHLSMLTGHYVHRHGLKKNGLEADPPYSLASTLKDAGWRTAAFTGHGSFQAKYGHGKGFETFESWTGEEAWPFTRNLGEVVPRALAWLDLHEDEDADRPFFLMVHGYDPHCPYWPPKAARQRFAGWYRGGLNLERVCGPPQFKALIQRGHIGEEELRVISDLYDAELFLADEVLGGFFDALEERGLFEDTLVVFTSDHGEDLGAKQRVGHGDLTPGILSVPLVMRFPGAAHRGVTSAPVELVDIVPTILSALDLPAPAGVQGRDLMPLIRDESTPWEGERMRIAQANENYSLRFGANWKLDFGLEPDGRLRNPRLFDLSRDPGELDNLYPTPEGRRRFEEATAMFLEWRRTSAGEDASLYAGEAVDETQRDQGMLEALGYTDGGQ